MRKITFATLFALALIIVSSAASAAEPVDWQKHRDKWAADIKTKTTGIPVVEVDYRDKLCLDKKKTERKKQACFAAFNEIVRRAEDEKGMLQKMIDATYLPSPERERVGHKAFQEYKESDDETTRLFHKAREEFK